MKRRLLSTRRSVADGRAGEYHDLWERVRAAVDGAGGHAWRFRAAGRPESYIEFIESRDLGTLLALASVAAAREALRRAFGDGTAEEWEEAATP